MLALYEIYQDQSADKINGIGQMSLYWSIICFVPLLKTNTRSTSVSYIKGITENRRDNAMSIALQKQMYGCRCLTTILEGKL